MTTADGDTTRDEQADGPLVEQLECEVVDGDLSDPEDHLSGPLDQADSGGHVAHLSPTNCFTGLSPLVPWDYLRRDELMPGLQAINSTQKEGQT